jgi:hypothetical protein
VNSGPIHIKGPAIALIGDSASEDDLKSLCEAAMNDNDKPIALLIAQNPAQVLALTAEWMALRGP